MFFGKLVALVLCLFPTSKSALGSVQSPDLTTGEDEAIYKKYEEMDRQLKKVASEGLKTVLPLILEAGERTGLSQPCMNNFLQLTSGLRQLKLSAISFLDACGKPPSGFLNGNLHMLGDYDQCLEASMSKRSGEVSFRGKYCLIHYRPLLPMRKRPVTFDSGVEELVEATTNNSELLRFLVSKAQLFYYNPSKYGACIPSGCNMEDIENIVTYIGEKVYINASVVYCDANEENFLDKRNIVFISLFVLLGTFVLVGTLVEYFSWGEKGNLKFKGANVLLCFSLLTNFPLLIKKKGSENNISCLNGIRALTLFYVIMLHQYYTLANYYMSSHVNLVQGEISQFFFQIVANGFLIADVFFFIGGLFSCYTRMKVPENEKRKTNVILIILHRLIRIGPAYMFFCFLMALFPPYGPMRLFEKTYVEKCTKYWWQNALFINNFFFQGNTCAPHTWYIAADMQLFLLSLFTVPLFFKSPKKGIIVNSIVIVLGILFTVVWSLVHKLTPGVVLYRPNEEEINSAWNVHAYTFPHVAPYFTGVLVGYFLAEKKDVKMTNLSQAIGWVVATALFLTMLFLTQVWNSGGTFTVAGSAFYLGLSKFLFTVAIAWMVLCCTTGNGGIINYILSLPLWVPVANISFVVYLVAPFLQNFYFANSRMMLDGHRMHTIWRFAGDTVIACSLGLALVLSIEMPFVRIEKLLHGILFTVTVNEVEITEQSNRSSHPEMQGKNSDLELDIKCLELELNHKTGITP